MKTRLIVILFLLATFWSAWQLGAGTATDYIFWGREELNTIFNIPYSWRNILGAEGMGQSVLSTLWSWPVLVIYGGLAKIGFDFSLISRLLGFLPIILVGVYSIDKLLASYKFSAPTRLAGSLVYLSNTYIVLLVDGGQIFIALAYAILPLSFYFFRNQKIEKFIVSVAVLSFLDPRVILIVLFLAFLEALFSGRILIFLKALLLVTLAYVGIHMYWILPTLVYPKSFSGAVDIGFGAQGLNFATIGHSLTLLQPHWYKNVFGKVVHVDVWFTFIPALALIAPIFRKRSKEVAFWLIVLVVGVFFAKGVNPPVGGMYEWMNTNIPGFWLFRDSTKFYTLTALALSVLVSYTLSKFRIWGALLIVLYIVVLLNPVWRGKMTGYLSRQPFSEEHQKVGEVLEKDREFGRVLWVPSVAPLSFSSPTHPQALGYLTSKKRPFASGRIGRYEVYNFLREAPYMGEIADITGIGYIAYPYPDPRREELKEDQEVYYNTFLDQLSNLPWIEKKVNDYPVPLFKTKKSQDHLFIANNTWYVIGSDQLYSELEKVENLEFSNNALIFAEEKTGLSGLLEESDGVNILLYSKSKIDLAANLVSPDYYTFPSSNLERNPDDTGWWKRNSIDFVWMKDFLQQKYNIYNQDFTYNSGWAISEGDNKLTINNQQFNKGNILLARVMKSSRGGKVEFWQGEEKVGEIDTRIKKPEKVEIKLTGYEDNPDQLFEYDKSNFSWFEVGYLVSNSQSLIIRTEGVINIVNALVSISSDEWDAINSSVDNFDE
jgi:hypothetical protein